VLWLDARTAHSRPVRCVRLRSGGGEGGGHERGDASDSGGDSNGAGGSGGQVLSGSSDATVCVLDPRLPPLAAACLRFRGHAAPVLCLNEAPPGLIGRGPQSALLQRRAVGPTEAGGPGGEDYSDGGEYCKEDYGGDGGNGNGTRGEKNTHGGWGGEALVVSGSADGSVRLWDARFGAAPVAVLRGHAGAVVDLHWAARSVALHRPPQPSAPSEAEAGGEGGVVLLSASVDGSVCAWELGSGELLRRFCAASPAHAASTHGDGGGGGGGGSDGTRWSPLSAFGAAGGDGGFVTASWSGVVHRWAPGQL